MRFILIISLFISYVAKSQIIADTVIAIEPSGDTVKIVTYKNISTSPFATISAMNDALALKQNILGFTPLNPGNNLSEVTPATARSNLGLVIGTHVLAPNGSAANLTSFPTLNQNTTGSAATLTTSRNIQGVAFNGSANINIIDGTGFVKAAGTTISYDNSTYQPLATNLTSIGALANGNGFLKNNGSGVFTYENPAGSGTVTNTGTLTSNSVVLGNGTSDTKVVAGITTNGTAQLVLGVNTTTLGSVRMFGNTSGDATVQPSAVAGTNTVITLPNVSGTVMLNTATSGVATTPTASGTVQYAHGLGRIPTIIYVYGIGTFTSNAAATPTPFSIGNFTSSGNNCVYIRSTGTTTQAPQTSNTFAIFVSTSSGNFVSGVIQNVTSTTFDIVWTETGTATSQSFLWEAR